MGATEEQIALVTGAGIDAVAYVFILYSLASLLFLFVNMLISVYDRHANAEMLAKKASGGRARLNGHAAAADERQVRDAEEFELDGLMTDDEDEEHAARRKLLRDDMGEEEMGLMSPSTVGRNSDRVAP